MSLLCVAATTLLLGAALHTLLPDLRHRFFAWFNNRFLERSPPEMKALRAEVLKELRQVKYYPPSCHLTAVDPNPYFRRYYDANRANFPNIKAEDVIVGFGEDLSMVASGSVDAVVVTMVLCSVADVAKTLAEARRVLRQGGQLFFWEHVRDWAVPSGWLARCQDLLTGAGVWPFLFDGCHLNRDALRDIQDAGFSEVKHKKKYAPRNSFIFQVVSPMVMGVATK